MDGKMYEATRLTREGQLNEATLAIQGHLELGRHPTGASDPKLIKEKFRLTAKSAKLANTVTVTGVPTHAEEVHPIAAERPVEHRYLIAPRFVLHCPVCNCQVCKHSAGPCQVYP